MKRVVMAGILALGVILTAGAAYGESFRTVKVTADALNVREFNNQESKQLGQAKQGQELVVINEAGEWYAIRLDGNQIGYVKKEFCEAVSAYAKGSVTKTDVNLRDKPATEGSTVLTRVQPGQPLQVLGRENGWYKVTVGDKTGYIREDMMVLGTPSEDATVSRGGDRQELVDFAKAQLGKPYRWGKAGPDSFDCSGFVSYVYKSVYGMNLGHSSTGMSSLGVAVNKSDLAVGDLVFFGTGGSSRINHVGIYIGGGKFIHASSSGTNGKEVVISPITSGYYSEVYKGARRVLK